MLEANLLYSNFEIHSLEKEWYGLTRRSEFPSLWERLTKVKAVLGDHLRASNGKEDSDRDSEASSLSSKVGN